MMDGRQTEGMESLSGAGDDLYHLAEDGPQEASDAEDLLDIFVFGGLAWLIYEAFFGE
jgi:hypothetical protein